MNIIIAGDLVPTKSNIDLFNNADINALIGDELANVWNSADVRIFNLEVPLTDKEDPIAKCGPNLIAPTSTIWGIKKLNPSLIVLANNHILDQGWQGLKSTRDILNSKDIANIGAGDNLNEARRPHLIEKNGIRVGIYACTEHEFSIASVDAPGANPFDPLESLDHIQELKTHCDYVIVIYHGGKEHYRYPSPYLQRACRKIVEKGADLVICQHSHCIGCYEHYNSATIIYGQGNFIFDHHDNEYWKTSLLIKVSINGNMQIDYIPIIKIGNCVRLATGLLRDDVLCSFHQRSQEILQDGFIERKYREFARDRIDSYLRVFSGFGKWISIFDRKLLNRMLLKLKYKKKDLLAIRNYIECEAHRDLIIEGIKKGRIE